MNNLRWNDGLTYSLIEHGTVVNKPEPGDLLFFGKSNSHVAIYIGGGQIVDYGSDDPPRIKNVDINDVISINSYLPKPDTPEDYAFTSGAYTTRVHVIAVLMMMLLLM